jgi:uncharacterized protein
MVVSPGTALRSRLLRWLGLALLAYGAVLVLLWFGQEKLMFAPRTLAAEHRFNFGPDVDEVWIEVPGARLNALHLKRPGARGVVFYLHGNAGHLQSWFANANWWRERGWDLFMLDYRGFGKSSGRIRGEAELHADVRAAWNTMLARYGASPPASRVLFGRSLGTGLALHLAADVADEPPPQPALTVLVSPYLSLKAMAREVYPWVPTALLRYPMRSDQALTRFSSPVLALHGTEDALIPIAQARSLVALAPQRARLVEVAGADHNNLQQFETYLQALESALQAAAPKNSR